MSTTAQTIPQLTNSWVFRLVTQTNDKNFAQGGVLPRMGSESNEVFGIKRIARFYQKATTGAWASNTAAIANAGYATGTVTLSGVTFSNQVSVAGLTFTAVTAQPASVQSSLQGATALYAIGASTSTAASNLAAVINNNQQATQLVGASQINSSNAVGIWSVVPGTIGNQITLLTGVGVGGIQTSGPSLVGGTEFGFGVAAHGA